MGGPSVTRGDITFAASTFTMGGASSTVGRATVEAFFNPQFTVTSTLGSASLSGTDTLMFSEIFSNQNNMQLTLASLSASSSYRLIILHGEPRGSINGTFTDDTFFSGGTSFAVGTYSFSNGTTTTTNADYASISVDFTGYTTVTYRMPQSARGASISGYALQVSAIPEPSTYALLFGAGALGFVMVRRKRATLAA